MATRRGSVLVKAAAGVLMLGAAGAAARHWSDGGCPLGLCHAGKDGAVRSVSLDCPMSEGTCSTVKVRIATTEADYFVDADSEEALAADDATEAKENDPLKSNQKPDEAVATNGSK